MDFDDSQFNWGDYTLSSQLDGLDQQGRISIAGLARAEKAFEEALAGKLPAVDAKKVQTRRESYAYRLEVPFFDPANAASREVRRLTGVPNRIFEYLNTLSLMAPSKVPSSLRQEIIARKSAIAALENNIVLQIKNLKDYTNPTDIENANKQIEASTEELRLLCTNFTSGIDIRVLRLAKEVQKASLVSEKVFDSQSQFLNQWDAGAQAIYKTGEYAHSFLTGKTDIRTIARQAVGLFRSVSNYRLKSIVQDARNGKLGKNPLLREVLKRNLFRLPPSILGSRLVQTLSKLGAQFTKLLAALAAPVAAIAAVFVGLAAFWISKKRSEIEFSNNLLESVGLINQLASSRINTSNPMQESDRFLRTVYGYFYDSSSTYSVSLPNGSKISVQSNKVLLGLDEKKYAQILDPLVKYGITLADIESEFHTAELSPLLGDATNISGRVINLKEPLELQYALAQVYGTDTEDLGKNVSEWSFSYGNLITESQESLAALYQISSESMVNPNKFRTAVVEMSDSFGYFASRAEFLGRKLSELLRKGVYGLDRGKELLTGVLQELTGYSTREMIGILGQTVSEDAESLQEFLIESRKAVDEQISTLQRRNQKITDRQQKLNNEANIQNLQALRDSLNFYIASKKEDSLDLSKMASVVQNLFHIFPDLAFSLSEKTLAARFATIYGGRLPNRELNFDDLIRLKEASKTAGFSSDRVADYVAGKRYVDREKAKGMPARVERLTSDDLRRLVMSTAINLTAHTVSFADLVGNLFRSWADKFYLTLEALKQVTVGLFSSSEETPTPTPPAPTTVDTPQSVASPFASSSKVVDYTHMIPDSGKRDHAPKVKAIVLHSTEGNLQGSLDLWKSGSRTSAHYIIGRDGVVYRTVPESQVAKHAGKIGYKSPLVKSGEFQAGQDFNEYSLGIELEHRKAGDTYSDAAYRSAADLVARQMAQYGVSMDHIISHADVAAGRHEHGEHDHRHGEYRSDPVNFDWEKFKRYLAAARAQYQVEAPRTPPKAANAGLVSQVTRQVSSNSTLDKYLQQAWDTQETLRKNNTYETFSSYAKGFFGQYKPETLRDMLRGSGGDRVKLYKMFAEKFQVKLNPSVFMRLLDAYLKDLDNNQKNLEEIARSKAKKAFIADFRKKFNQLYAKDSSYEVHTMAIEPLRVGLDQEFQEGLARAGIDNKANIYLEEHDITIFTEGTAGTQFHQKLLTMFSPQEIDSLMSTNPTEILTNL